jgi:diguanylate cyclase (GGDEF)-like protein
MWNDLKKGKTWEGRFKNLSKDGRTLIINSKIIPKYNKENEIVGYVAIRTDITDKELARIDTLTGLPNRLKFQEKISDKISEYLIHNRKNSLSIIDIDHFKSVNDKYGHLAGDSVLKEFVEIIKKHIRRDDLFARWGGEEFVLVLSIGEFDITLKKLEEIKKNISEHTFKHVGKVTASFGLVEISDNYLTANKLFEKADECLYKAKSNGRNRICYIDSTTQEILEIN